MALFPKSESIFLLTAEVPSIVSHCVPLSISATGSCKALAFSTTQSKGGYSSLEGSFRGGPPTLS